MTNPPWTGMLPVDDTALAVTDTAAPPRPCVYLNGAYADTSHWRRVVADLGEDYRHITYDERARGRSERSADYSFDACLRDLDAVLAARGVDRALLVGWSYGGFVSWHWADRNPDRVLGVVTVDAFPIGLTGVAGRDRIRTLFRRLRWLFPIASRLGLAARMSADEHAEVNIELNEIAAAARRSLSAWPARCGSSWPPGTSLGNRGDEMEHGRATLDPILARNPNLAISAKVASNHSKILRNDSPAVARAVRELAPGRCPHDGPGPTAAEPVTGGLTIGQAAAFAGVTVKTLRHYHRLGLVDEPRRDTSGYRRYTSTDLFRLVQVRALAEAGVPLAEVGDLLDADHERFADALATWNGGSPTASGADGPPRHAAPAGRRRPRAAPRSRLRPSWTGSPSWLRYRRRGHATGGPGPGPGAGPGLPRRLRHPARAPARRPRVRRAVEAQLGGACPGSRRSPARRARIRDGRQPAGRPHAGGGPGGLLSPAPTPPPATT
jgi:DNA-binding transcriptional MerR regulator/pimeloyl-ACP methyl ester carboxylesterase